MKSFKARGCVVIGIGISASVLSPSAQAQIRERTFFQASRALAMGDAYTAYGDGPEAVYYNPAGVARKGMLRIKLIDAEMVSSQTTLSILRNTISSFGAFGGLTTLATQNVDKPISIGMSFLPQLLIKNFSIGMIARTYTEFYLKSSDANLYSYSFADAGLYGHMGTALFGGVLKLGAGAKVLDRAELNRIYTPAEYAASSLKFSEQWQEGLGFGFDAGMLVTAPFSLLPALGIAMTDIGNTKLAENHILFTNSQTVPGSPPSIRQRLNVGLSINPKHGRGVRSLVSLEGKDLLQPSSTYYTYWDRLHLGYELNIRDAIYLRGGLNQGHYWTAGIGVKVAVVSIELATYGENIAFTGQPRIGDRKFVGRYVLSF